MKQNSIFKFLLVISLLLLSSCSKKDSLDISDNDEDISESFANTTTILRDTKKNDEVAEAFIGYGYDAFDSPSKSPFELYHVPVLDRQKIADRSPWNAWGAEIPRDFLPVRLISQNIPGGSIYLEDFEDYTDSFNAQTFALDLGETYEKLKFNIAYKSSEHFEEKSYTGQYYVYKEDKRISLGYKNTKNLQYYLTPSFASNVKTISAEDLVKKYGTNVIVQYSFGVYNNLMLAADSKVFTKDEVKKLVMAGYGAGIEASLENKLKKNLGSVHVIYAQGGGDYYPEYLESDKSIFTSSAIYPISKAEWRKSVKPKEGTVIDVRKTIVSVPIPDLIEDIKLKIKYTSGILHHSSPGKTIYYVLCDPNTYQPILYKKNHIFTSMEHFDSSLVSVYYGDTRIFDFSEYDITKQGSDDGVWKLNVENENGMWTIKKPKTDLYLCRDFKLRHLKEDPNNLRYWILNPIVPQEGYYPLSWNNMLVQVKKDK